MTVEISTITAAEVRRRKMALEAKLRELLGMDQRAELEIEVLADPLDQVRSNAEREVVVQRIDQHTRMIREIRQALMRIEHGTYGACERCEEAIPRKRLDVVPWARLCVPCQEEVEAGQYEGAPEFEHAA